MSFSPCADPDSDLHGVIKKGSLLKDIHKRYVMYQLFKAIKYLHSGNVIHRDQKVCHWSFLLLLLFENITYSEVF